MPKAYLYKLIYNKITLRNSKETSKEMLKSGGVNVRPPMYIQIELYLN